MKDIKQQADELVNKFISHSYHDNSIKQCTDHAIQCAIASTENTIKVLNFQFDRFHHSGFLEISIGYLIIDELIFTINEQTELLKELKSRL